MLIRFSLRVITCQQSTGSCQQITKQRGMMTCATNRLMSVALPLDSAALLASLAQPRKQAYICWKFLMHYIAMPRVAYTAPSL